MLMYVHVGNMCAGETTSERFSNREFSATFLEFRKTSICHRCCNFCCKRRVPAQSFLLNKYSLPPVP